MLSVSTSILALPLLLTAPTGAVALSAADSAAPGPRAPHGRYVEARTASVFAGACHYGSEATTTGREALLAWHFEGGAHAGVDLGGVDVVAVIAGERNLAEAGTRHARLYISERASLAQRAAVQALLVERLATVFGTLDAVQVVPMTFAANGVTYALEAKDLFELRGATLVDRACCSMPSQVWYAPFAPVERPIVGTNDAFRFDDKRLGRIWSRPDENASFSGSFRFTPPPVPVR